MERRLDGSSPLDVRTMCRIAIGLGRHVRESPCSGAMPVLAKLHRVDKAKKSRREPPGSGTGGGDGHGCPQLQAAHKPASVRSHMSVWHKRKAKSMEKTVSWRCPLVARRLGGGSGRRTGVGEGQTGRHGGSKPSGSRFCRPAGAEAPGDPRGPARPAPPHPSLLPLSLLSRAHILQVP